jgi:Dolichyl-phosphate-mannose-protein mannosyltransferase
MKLRTLLSEGCESLSSFLDRRFTLIVSILLAFLLSCSILQDLRNPMWFDELCTLRTAQEPSARAVIQTILDGIDGSAPLYALTVHAFLKVVHPEVLAVRLPSTIGYTVMMACLFIFCRRRMDGLYALLPPLLVWTTTVYYATEGRCYGVVLGFFGIALLCWQAIKDGRHRWLALTGLSLSVALMVAAHFYALFFLAPLCVVEAISFIRERRFDLPLLLGTIVPCFLVIALHRPLIAAGIRYAPHFWSPASWSEAAPTAVCLFLIILLLGSPTGNKPAQMLKEPEWIMFGALALCPLLTILISLHTTHVFVPRYVLWTVPAFAVLMVTLLFQASRGRAGVGSILLTYVLFGLIHKELRRPNAHATVQRGDAAPPTLHTTRE